MDEQELERRRAALAARWKRLADSASKANNPTLEAHALAEFNKLEHPVQLGDRVATLTKALGIPPCDDCKKRQAALNQVDTTQSLYHVIQAAALAILKPQLKPDS